MSLFVIMGSTTDYCEVVCNDIKDLENVIFINKLNNIESKILRFLHRAHMGISNRIIPLPFKSIWYRSYLSNAQIPNDKIIYFIFFDSNAHVYNVKFLEYLKNKYNAKLIVYIVNPITSTIASAEYYKKNFDLALTPYIEDAHEHGLNVGVSIYSKPTNEVFESDGLKKDVFFVGDAKDRLQTLIKIYERFTSNNISCDFNIVNVKENEKKYEDDISYNKRMPYQEVLRRVNQCKCILEVIQSGQKGSTMRRKEAILFNKKLITNNSLAPNYPFYKEKYVQTFVTPEEIDCDFIKDNIDVNYGYNNEYSPVYLLELIENYFEGQLRRESDKP